MTLISKNEQIMQQKCLQRCKQTLINLGADLMSAKLR